MTSKVQTSIKEAKLSTAKQHQLRTLILTSLVFLLTFLLFSGDVTHALKVVDRQPLKCQQIFFFSTDHLLLLVYKSILY